MKEFKKECVEKTTDTIIKFEENKKSIIFNNKERKSFCKVKVDGCQIKEGERCDDLLVGVQKGDEFFVELKGVDVSHALDQLEASLTKLSDTKNKVKKVCSYIICKNVAPSFMTKVQMAKVKFKKKFNSDLIISENKLEVEV